jgi:Carboxypeptidase regulatory-like domain
MPSSARGGPSGPAAGCTGPTPDRRLRPEAGSDKRPRRAAAVIAGLCLVVVALVMAPGAGAEGGGAISGVVTSASTHAPIGGVGVCAASTVVEGALGEEESKEQAEGEAEPPSDAGCTTTNASGQYTISGLASGGFYVEFHAPSMDLVSQFYDGKTAASEANQVSVSAGSTTTGINAEMQQGARISGTVTDASSGAPLPRIEVCAKLVTGEEESWCAFTIPSGAYTISGLPSGSYVVVFRDVLFASGYQTQYYDDKPSRAEATILHITAPNVTTGINAALLPGNGHTPGGSLGSGGSQGSNPGTTQTPGSQSPLTSGFDVVVRSTKISVRSGLALVLLRCHAACRGTLTLEVTQTVRHDGKKRKRTVAIGAAGFSLPAEHTAVVKVKLNTMGRTLLKHAHGRLDCRVSVTQMVPAPKRIKYLDARLLAQAAHTQARRRKP